jgi:soluble lytic murein transglycosylase-like protein
MMTTLTRYRRSFAAALMLTLLLTAAPLMSSSGATAAETTADRTTVRRSICDIDWKRSRFQLKRLIRCAARRWDVNGGPDKAVAVARCESRFNPRAYNPGGYAGVYQQATRYWPTRATTYGFHDYSVYNGRANIMVSVRMAHRGGWGPWACA